MSLLNENRIGNEYSKRVGNRKFNLLLCELHYSPVHGKTRSSWPYIEGHFMLIELFDGVTGFIPEEIENYQEYSTDEEDINSVSDDSDTEGSGPNVLTNIHHIQRLYKSEYNELSRWDNLTPHKTIRNYNNIIRKPDYIRPEIGECFELPTCEQIVIIKTIWIRIIQRKWKAVFANRQKIIKLRCCPSSISTRQLTGKWPEHCRVLPGICGMLSNLL
jgi:hypothetical protein